MPIYTYNGKILTLNGAVATSADCCCDCADCEPCLATIGCTQCDQLCTRLRISGMVDSFAICENLCGIFNGIWRTVDPVYSRGPCRFGGGFAGEDPVTCGFNEYYYELQWALDCRINGVGGIDLFPSVRLRYWNSVGGFFSLTNPIPGIAVLPARTLSEGPCSNIFGDYPVSAENWTTDGRPSVYSCYDPPQEAVIEVYPCDAAGDGGEDVEIIL